MTWGDRNRSLAQVLGYVLPHDVKYGRADKTVLDGAGKQKRAGVLDQGAHDVRTSTLEHVVGTLETAGDPSVGGMVTTTVLVAMVAVSVAAQM